MKIVGYTMLILSLTMVLSGCSTDSAEQANANAGAAPAAAAQPGQPAAAGGAPVVKKTATAPAATAVPAKPAAPRMLEVPEGTELSVLLIDSISTEKNKAGDQFMASLAEPVVVNGQTVVDRGAKVQGRVVDSESAGRVKGTANIRLVLTSIQDGEKTYPIVTKPFVAEAESSKGRDAGIIGGAAGVGAAIGAIAGGKKGAGKGAIIGGAAGTGTVLATKGKAVEFGSETKLKFTLDKAALLPKIGS